MIKLAHSFWLPRQGYIWPQGLRLGTARHCHHHLDITSRKYLKPSETVCPPELSREALADSGIGFVWIGTQAWKFLPLTPRQHWLCGKGPGWCIIKGRLPWPSPRPFPRWQWWLLLTDNISQGVPGVELQMPRFCFPWQQLQREERKQLINSLMILEPRAAYGLNFKQCFKKIPGDMKVNSLKNREKVIYFLFWKPLHRLD